MTARRCSYAGMQQQSQCVLANCGGSDAVKRGPIGAANIDLLRSTLYNHQQAQSNQRQQTPSRRTSRSSDVSTDMVCSQQSVLNVMDRFVKAVNNMDATVLVPSRLRDMDVTETTETGLSTGVGANNPLYFKGDLHSCFTMLHEAKNALLWGPSSPPSSHNPNVSCYSSSGSSTYGNQGSAYHNAALRVPSVTSQPSHKRQASNGSLGSAASSDPETDNDSSSLSDFADGPVPEGSPENGSVEPTASLSNAFRVHLNALHSILQQMADSADYLSSRYQHELEPSNGSR